AVGVLQKGWGINESLETFTKLTIGDGLVSQLPAFVISVASGLIVTRSSSRRDLSSELSSQLGGRTQVLGITSVFLGLLAFTGLPALPLLTMSLIMAGLAFNLSRVQKNKAAA